MSARTLPKEWEGLPLWVKDELLYGSEDLPFYSDSPKLKCGSSGTRVGEIEGLPGLKPAWQRGLAAAEAL